MKKITYIFYSELKDILHDPGILIFILFVPLAYPLLYSWVYTNEVVRRCLPLSSMSRARSVAENSSVVLMPRPMCVLLPAAVRRRRQRDG